MFANSLAHGARRRGIVLVLILGMLGLLALIGVTFATFAGQSLINARNFSRSENRESAEQYFDFALGQLINDTNNPLSALRGHSLLRDMYGNDSVHRGTTAAEIGGFLDHVTDNNGNAFNLQFTGTQVYQSNTNSPLNANGLNLFQFRTNIPTSQLSYQYNGLNFTRWILRVQSPVPSTVNSKTSYPTAAQTFEVIEDDDTGLSGFSNGYHVLTLSVPDLFMTVQPGPAASNSNNRAYLPHTGIYGGSFNGTFNSYYKGTGASTNFDPNYYGAQIDTSPSTSSPNYTIPGVTYPGTPVGLAPTQLADSMGNLFFPNPFILDGRYMRAFNGPGMNQSLIQAATLANSFFPLVPFNVAAYANFRVNGALVDPNFPTGFGSGLYTFPTATSFGDPDVIGMDEDYDACDLENWFLAIQSADGQVVIPSFHRPGILTAADWTSAANTANGVAGLSKILRPRAIDHGPQFGSAAPDPTPDPLTGRINYDLDNDGDGVTDSVWLDLGYPVQRDPGGKLFKPLFAFMVIGQNGRLPLNTVGNLQSRDYQTAKQYLMATYPVGSPNAGNPAYSFPANYYDAPTWDHTSHLGYSVNEINPKYALQNAPANVYSTNPSAVNNNPATIGDGQWSQVDNTIINDGFSFVPGINVAVTQLRNLLAGTVPQDNPLILTGNNNDSNYVAVGGSPYYMPNNVIDPYDTGYDTTKAPNQNQISRQKVTPVAGRWGEAEGVPTVLQIYNSTTTTSNGPFPSIFGIPAPGGPNGPYYPSNFGSTFSIFTNPVRAGRSYYGSFNLGNGGPNALVSYQNTNEAMDDDNDSYDPMFNSSLLPPLALALAEYGQPIRDPLGQIILPVERMQRFVTPVDPSGTGRLVGFMNRPDDVNDFGKGYDNLGRVGFFRYFRPPGLPRDVTYQIPSTYLDSYKMAVFNYNAALGIPMIPVRTNNLYHGYEGFRAPITNTSPYSGVAQATAIATSGAMPYDIYSFIVPNTPPAAPTVYNAIPVAGDSSGTNPELTATNPAGFTGPTASAAVNSESGPYLFNNAPPTAGMSSYYQPYMDQNPGGGYALNARVVNGYPLGSLNKDEADEMNLYAPNRDDMQFGPSDLEWLYRKQDVDGSTLNSRLSKLAPISFMNPKDGTMRRRFFSVDSWEPNSFVYANDNPQGAFTWNSRFGHLASASLALTNQVPVIWSSQPTANFGAYPFFASAFAVEGLPNPTLPVPIGTYTPYPNSPNAGSTVPVAMTGSLTATSTTELFGNRFINSSPVSLISGANHEDLFVRPNPTANSIASPTITPSLAHRDRRINLNYPLPVASDPAEPVRQKWVRETYQLLKSILPPQSVDTPQELAALSQYVVNIIDFRDTDSTMTRFVNTDLMVVPADPTAHTPSNVKFATMIVPGVTDPMPAWDPNSPQTPITFGAPFDPNIALEQTNPCTDWTTAMSGADPFLVQYGMEFNPIAINEVLCYTGNGNNGTGGSIPFSRFYIELVNTLNDDSAHAAATGAEDLRLTGWDFVIMADDVQGRPDPITGCLTPNIGGIAAPAPIMYYPASGAPVPPVQGNMPPGTASLPTPATVPPNPAPPSPGTFPTTSIGWSLGSSGLESDFTTAAIVSRPIAPIQGSTGGTASVKYYVMANSPPLTGAGTLLDPIPVDNNPDCIIPNGFMPSTTVPTSMTGKFYWLYLRRPANPFNHSTEMVVVDAMRFAWAADDGMASSISSANPTVTRASTTQLYSAQRLQPYRGGHLVPNTTDNLPNPPFAYGYSEQTVGDTTSQLNAPSAATPNRPSPPTYAYAVYPTTATSSGVYFTSAPPATSYNTSSPAVLTTMNTVLVSKAIRETIGGGPTTGSKDPSWDYFPFHDRDFSSPAELLLVPGCPPGLFTKQFAELAFSPGGTTGTPISTGNIGGGNSANTPSVTTKFTAGQPHAFPYLPDKFYYTAASVAPDIHSSADYPTQVGGWTGTGWHKMFEFFEVPSSANGSTGTAAAGENFDWARADRKPGLVNLNLIVDEEVFFGVLDDPRLNMALGYYSNNYSGTGNMDPQNPTFNYNANWQLPWIVTQVDSNGYVSKKYSISDPKATTTTYLAPGQALATNVNSNGLAPLKRPLGNTANANVGAVGRGFLYGDPTAAGLGTAQNTIHGMKGAFLDFLMLRHGGSPYLFGHGSGQVQDASTVPAVVAPINSLPADAPYHSLSYPDINYTIMRPAYMPPSALTRNLPDPTNPYQYQPGSVALLPANPLPTDPGSGNYVLDPGVRFPYLDLNFNTSVSTATLPTVPQIPPVPPRRLFQIPDHQLGTTITGGTGNPSNASLVGDNSINLVNPNYNLAFFNNLESVPGGNSLFRYDGTNTNTYSEKQYVAAPFPANQGAAYGTQGFLTQDQYLGANTVPMSPDNRQHPAYRTELLQKVMNLTTVRTHQFAVWITVGFFEITKLGTPELGIPDVLGAELGLADGKNVRYRTFVVIDRTLATGFNPYYPGDFRTCVTYRRRIE